MSSTRRLRTLGARVARELEAAGPDVEQIEASRLRLLSSLRRRRPTGSLLVRGALIAATCLGVGAVWVALRGPAPLEFRVAGDEGSNSVPLLVAEKRLPVTFSDGTRFEMERGARARIAAVTARGALLVLEGGRAEVDVVPRPGAAWEVAAGPFRITVKGTRFGVSWSPERDELSVDLHEGNVTVEGCHLRRPELLSAGRRLVASCKEPNLSVTALVSSPVASVGDPERPAPAAGPPEAPESGVADVAPRVAVVPAALEGSSPASPAPSWTDLSRAGRFVEGFEQARADHVLERLDALDTRTLLLLGDTARLSGHSAEARSTYAALRRRAPGTEQAAVAAFSLARLDLDRGQIGSGARWLEVYLAEAPEGDLSGAALGRLFDLSARRGDSAEARSLASRYLARHPDGAHADEARRFISAPR